jgi:hypothetical protein
MAAVLTTSIERAIMVFFIFSGSSGIAFSAA